MLSELWNKPIKCSLQYTVNRLFRGTLRHVTCRDPIDFFSSYLSLFSFVLHFSSVPPFPLCPPVSCVQEAPFRLLLCCVCVALFQHELSGVDSPDGSAVGEWELKDKIK